MSDAAQYHFYPKHAATGTLEERAATLSDYLENFGKTSRWPLLKPMNPPSQIEGTVTREPGSQRIVFCGTFDPGSYDGALKPIHHRLSADKASVIRGKWSIEIQATADDLTNQKIPEGKAILSFNMIRKTDKTYESIDAPCTFERSGDTSTGYVQVKNSGTRPFDTQHGTLTWRSGLENETASSGIQFDLDFNHRITCGPA